MEIRVGDVVARRSYKCDLIFRVTKLSPDGKFAELVGEEMRLVADSPLDDLVIIDQTEHKRWREKEREKEDNSYRLFRQDYQLLKAKREYTSTNYYKKQTAFFELPGRVLHIDGDQLYLNRCLDMYKRLGVPVYGAHMKEHEMPQNVLTLINNVRPDILVITGHDAFLKNKGEKKDLHSYRNSKHFVRAVKEVRRVHPNLDHLVIFAGACQSHFESLIKAGANFASSPSRINIHMLDPVFIVSKISLTSFMDHVNVWDALRNTLTGEDGLGGVETKGILRTGMPMKLNQDSTT
ncbi:sporulation peptidase YabG [Pseudalkalibacillus caeni]|uniref:Sporulation peptidase YabG n=1 Tax=Exobacillus caeni TaxID=2574798 RepID=A0A5R9F2G2_9BACL|nr:sporulation peptidase YabG [Pseudalkalibacillus caeni]TLS35103.1 sporulation peptidase YabG [Pseudalkalibacillus caeni]